MKCDQVKNKLYLHVTNDLPWYWQSRVEKHLRKCKLCQKEMQVIIASQHLTVNSVKSKQIDITGNEIWDPVHLALSDKKTRHFRPVWTQAFLNAKWQWKLLLGAGIPFLVLGLLLWDQIFLRNDQPSKLEATVIEVPIVEDVEPGVTVMTFATADPKIKIVWFFKEN